MALSPLHLLILFLLPLTLGPATAIPPSTITTASEILSDTGFTATALLLPLIYTPLNLSSLTSATLFAPPDASFTLSLPSGQPPLSLLGLHFSPSSLSPAALLSLPPGSPIHTLSPNTTLTLNHDYNRNNLFLNGVHVSISPVFSDPSLVVYQIAHFFSPDDDSSNAQFTPSQTQTAVTVTPSFPSCPLVGPPTRTPFTGPSTAMRARGFSAMAALLELQLHDGNLTVFAPRDGAFFLKKIQQQQGVNDLDKWASVLKRHVVPCEVSWEDLVTVKDDDGAVVVVVSLPTFLDGFVINVTRSGDSLVLNDQVRVDLPELYGGRGDGVRVHGISGVLSLEGESFVEEPVESPDDRGEF